MNFLEELKWRGFIKDITDEQLLNKLIEEKATIYAGFDPTGKSLHLGHLIPINLLRHFQNNGHKVIGVLGGGTALIGDPKQTSERNLLSLEEVADYAVYIKKQLETLLDFKDDRAILENNYNWLGKINLVEYLRDYGKHFTVSYMLAKDVIASRLQSGISYTEFSYLILQSIDFLNLYQKHDCRIQLGGSDQWGNITSGIELIRRTINQEACGITLHLLTNSSGSKFGKSEGNALYLDKELTTPYKIYQYLLNVSDQDVIKYLKILTFLSTTEISKLEENMNSNPHLRLAQKALAYQTVKLLHGEEESESARKMSEVLFNGDIGNLSSKELLICLEGVPSIQITTESKLLDAIVEVGAAVSKREARQFITSNAITINGKIINEENFDFSINKAIDNDLFVLKRGKKQYYLLKLTKNIKQ